LVVGLVAHHATVVGTGLEVPDRVLDQVLVTVRQGSKDRSGRQQQRCCRQRDDAGITADHAGLLSIRRWARCMRACVRVRILRLDSAASDILLLAAQSRRATLLPARDGRNAGATAESTLRTGDVWRSFAVSASNHPACRDAVALIDSPAHRATQTC